MVKNNQTNEASSAVVYTIYQCHFSLVNCGSSEHDMGCEICLKLRVLTHETALESIFMLFFDRPQANSNSCGTRE